MNREFGVIVIGGGHAGVEAAWAAANLLGEPASVALVTLDPGKIGVMSCNPAIGGLAKGQIVREVDALGGLMGLAADATGIQFKVLNASKGVAVRGPRAQCDKHAYAESVQRLIASRAEIQVIAGSVEELTVRDGAIRGVVIRPPARPAPHSAPAALWPSSSLSLSAKAVVLTTGTFMRGLMHTGESRTEGGRFGEAAAVGISGALNALGFELGRLKTGTPPRLRRSTIRWNELEAAWGDERPVPFSELSAAGQTVELGAAPSLETFPVLPQVECRVTTTNAAAHEAIRANLHRAPMYSGQIESVGPRYCPSIEDKVVRFAERDSHQVFLEPESLRDDWIYCNGISTSLPRDVQDLIVRSLPGCEQAEVLRYGYAVEYDMVKPHQIGAGGMTKLVDGLFLAGQINGTSGYEEAAGQGVIAGINAALHARSRPHIVLGREQAYIGVLMDDLVTKTPVEPYRMFTSRAEHRLTLRADNSADRLTPVAAELGLLDTTPLGRARRRLLEQRAALIAAADREIDRARVDGEHLRDLVRRPEFTAERLGETIAPALRAAGLETRGHMWDDAILTVHTERFYAAYVERQRAQVRRQADAERTRLPADMDYQGLSHMRAEARAALHRFRPETLGQAARLEGLTPADITLLAVLAKRHRAAAAARPA